jgi:D-threo-aldose 1-dehydrogenase
MTVMPTRRLGRTDLDVSLLGFGGAPLGDLYARVDEETAIATVETAIDAGVTLFDSSPLYGHGLSEHRIGAALRRRPEARAVISTKVGRVADPHGPRGSGSGYVGGLPHGLAFDYSRDGAWRSLEQSLLRLGRDRIDIALIHDVDIRTHGVGGVEARFGQAMSGAYLALTEMRAQGVVGAIGVGVNEADMAARFAREGDFDAMLLAGRYSLLEQPALADFLPLAVAKGIAVLLGGVLNSGILATGAVPGARYDYAPAPPPVLARVEAIARVCAAHAVGLFHAALAFAAGHPAVASLVLGAVAPAEVAAQATALATPVPAGLWSDLVAAGLLDPAAPLPVS